MGLDGAQLSVGTGDYEQIERARRAAWKRLRQSLWGSTEHEERTRHLRELTARRAAYLHDLLARLPFRWHIEHAYTPNETAGYGGADHIIVDEPLRTGRLRREPGDALSRRRSKFWGLSSVEAERLPTALTDIRIAERLATGG
jgi:16S rRNA C967 or C1407 C5-methylase (RsmB/RsmF family)